MNMRSNASAQKDRLELGLENMPFAKPDKVILEFVHKDALEMTGI